MDKILHRNSPKFKTATISVEVQLYTLKRNEHTVHYTTMDMAYYIGVIYTNGISFNKISNGNCKVGVNIDRQVNNKNKKRQACR